MDPHTRQPFIYELKPDGFSLRSLGLDRDDDGGKHERRFGEKARRAPDHRRADPDGDFVFWPLQYSEPDKPE